MILIIGRTEKRTLPTDSLVARSFGWWHTTWTRHISVSTCGASHRTTSTSVSNEWSVWCMIFYATSVRIKSLSQLLGQRLGVRRCDRYAHVYLLCSKSYWDHGDAESRASQVLNNVINACLRMRVESFRRSVKYCSGALGLPQSFWTRYQQGCQLNMSQIAVEVDTPPVQWCMEHTSSIQSPARTMYFLACSDTSAGNEADRPCSKMSAKKTHVRSYTTLKKTKGNLQTYPWPQWEPILRWSNTWAIHDCEAEYEFWTSIWPGGPYCARDKAEKWVYSETVKMARDAQQDFCFREIYILSLPCRRHWSWQGYKTLFWPNVALNQWSMSKLCEIMWFQLPPDPVVRPHTHPISCDVCPNQLKSNWHAPRTLSDYRWVAWPLWNEPP